eukprot:TRINITY_DN82040_c0_g1_i1.p1 TRINITY_DN82040_c0_g1~~TRINITY_DN82040_c0_g1_i1.p1  ORF type:complete len:403 (-),score=69.13 TRINITY_DN82040_c0_g1_i1:433-1641(-)
MEVHRGAEEETIEDEDKDREQEEEPATIKVRIDFLDAGSLELELSSESRVRDIKEAIQRKLAIPRKLQRLIKESDLLDDSLTLSSLEHSHEDLHLSCIRLPPGKICVVGGSYNAPAYEQVDREPLATMSMFDPITCEWTHPPRLAVARRCLAGALLGGHIFVLGGQDEQGQHLSTVDVFDPTTETWSSAAPMSDARSNFAVAVLDGKLFATGGMNEYGRLNTAEVFDPCLGGWNRLPNMLDCRCCHAAAAVQGMIFVAGGYDGMFMLRTVEVWEPAKGAWASMVSMHEARRDLAAVGLEGKLYIVGGKKAALGGGNYNVLTCTEVFDTATMTWSTLPASLQKRRDSLAAVVLNDGKICVVGGKADDSVWSCIEVLDTTEDNPNWTLLAEMPTARHSLAAVAC